MPVSCQNLHQALKIKGEFSSNDCVWQRGQSAQGNIQPSTPQEEHSQESTSHRQTKGSVILTGKQGLKGKKKSIPGFYTDRTREEQLQNQRWNVLTTYENENVQCSVSTKRLTDLAKNLVNTHTNKSKIESSRMALPKPTPSSSCLVYVNIGKTTL